MNLVRSVSLRPRLRSPGREPHPTKCRDHLQSGRTGASVAIAALTVLLMFGISTSVASASTTLWGVDSDSTITAPFLGQIDSTLGHPDFFGRYLITLSKAEVNLAFSQGVSILLIENRPTSNKNLMGSATGVAAADVAAASATALGAPAGTGIYVDIEAGDPVDGPFIQGWHDEIIAKGYVPGYYGNPYPGSGKFPGAYCSTAAATNSTAIWSDEPQLARSPKATKPAFAPDVPPCASDTVLWQYGIRGLNGDPAGSFCAINTCPHVDTDLATAGAHLWSSGTMPADPTKTSYTGPTMGGHNQAVALSAHLVDTTTSAAVTGRTIAFTLGTQGCSGATDGSGDASCSITLTQPPGDYTVTAAFAGDAAFTASSDSKAFTITRTPTTTTVSAVPPDSSKFGQPVTFTATVAGIGSPGGSPPTGSVTFTIDGRTFAAIPLTGGSASFATAALGAGPHTITASYGGDADFLPSSGDLAYAVTCDVNVTGVHQGALTVTTSTCLAAGARVNGAVIVEPGGALDVEASTIIGAIGATEDAGAIRVCGSTIGGAVDVKGAAGLVIVGDPAIGCAPNVIGGALDVKDNTNGVEAIDNSVGGAILTDGNSGPGPFPGDTTTISGNHHPATVPPPAAGPGSLGSSGAPGTQNVPSAQGAPARKPDTPAGSGVTDAPTHAAPVVSSPRVTAPAKRLTQTQKLAIAIHACGKLTKAKKRTCVAMATKRYPPPRTPARKR